MSPARTPAAVDGNHKAQLLARLERRDAVVAVIGLGYVGLPLAMAFCDAGLSVIGFDISEAVVARLSRGESHILDVPAMQVAGHVASSRFQPTADEARLSGADCISIAVPTSLTKARKPDLSHVRAACAAVARHVRRGALVVLESSTYPGTTRDLLVPGIVRRGFQPGSDIFVAYSPERVDPRNRTWRTENTPRLVGGMTPACTEVAAALYRTCVTTVVPVSSAETAELAKLLENTFRLVNIGLVNEMTLICDRLGVDVREVIDAAATKPFGFMRFEPGPGVGGHCIPVDPLYLAWKMRQLGRRTKFIDLASAINWGMPKVVVDRVALALRTERARTLKGSRVLVLGVAYKRDMDDLRESPALEVIRLLEKRGARVTYHDPHVPRVREGARERAGVALTDQALAAADAVVIVTDHAAIDWARVAVKAALIVDTRNVPALAGQVPARVIGLSSRAADRSVAAARKRTAGTKPRRRVRS